VTVGWTLLVAMCVVFAVSFLVVLAMCIQAERRKPTIYDWSEDVLDFVKVPLDAPGDER
jgi:hypothetical protein